nr:phage late control protein [Saccharospirillaceae bacterium]
MNPLKPTRKAPAYRIIVNGEDITAAVGPRLKSLRLNDNRGTEADTVTLTLNDNDGELDLPPTGAEMQVAIGWQGDGLVDKGLFIVDETSHRGPPDRISVKARSANMRQGLPGRKSRSWEDTTIGEVVETIASEHNLEYSVSDGLSGLRIGSLHQTDESDLNLLTRLAERHDAIATIKADQLLFLPMSLARTLSGKAIPTQRIDRSDTQDHAYSEADRETVTGVRAKWNDVAGGSLNWVLAGDSETTTDLSGTYASEDDARHAAEAELNRRKRGGHSMEITLAEGQPGFIVETPLKLRGWKPRIDNAAWVATQVTHQITDSQAYTLTLSCETTHDP